jgi:hypothetical protein
MTCSLASVLWKEETFLFSANLRFSAHAIIIFIFAPLILSLFQAKILLLFESFTFFLHLSSFEWRFFLLFLYSIYFIIIIMHFARTRGEVE